MGKQNRPKRYRKVALMFSYVYEQNARADAGLSSENPHDWFERRKTEIKELGEKCVYIAFSPLHEFDQKIGDDGNVETVEPHFHVVMHLGEPLSKKQLMKQYGVSREQNIKPIKNVKIERESLRYLVHATDKALSKEGGKLKFLYDASSVELVWGIGQESKTYQELILGDIASEEDEYRQTLQDADLYVATKLMSGEWTMDDAKNYYCNDPDGIGLNATVWGRKKRLCQSYHEDWLDDEKRWYIDERNPRCHTLTYITGVGRSGKDNLADLLALHYADNHGIHDVATNGKDKTFDFADGYKGQAVAIFTEVAGNCFGVDEFNNAFDPKRGKNVNSRNKDKPLWHRWSFLVNSNPCERLIDDMYKQYAREHIKGARDAKLETQEDWKRFYESDPEAADKICQIRGRFAVMVRIVNELAHYYYRNNNVNRPTTFLDEPISDQTLWLGISPMLECDVFKKDDLDTCKKCKYHKSSIERGMEQHGCTKPSEYEWKYVGACSLKDEQGCIAMHEQSVRLYYEQDPEYFTVNPWNTPTRQEVLAQQNKTKESEK